MDFKTTCGSVGLGSKENQFVLILFIQFIDQKRYLNIKFDV